MRHARIKPDHEDTWHHCHNRAVGTRDGRPFGDAEKRLFVREAVRRARPAAAKPSHRLARSGPAPGAPEPLFCWRRLRPALE